MASPAKSPNRRRMRSDEPEAPRTPRQERSDERDKRHCPSSSIRGEDEVNLPLGTPHHTSLPPSSSRRCISPKADLFEVPPPKLAKGLDLQLLRTSTSSRRYLRENMGSEPFMQQSISSASLEHELNMTEAEGEGAGSPVDYSDVSSLAIEPHRVCHLSDWHSASSSQVRSVGADVAGEEAEFQRLGLSASHTSLLTSLEGRPQSRAASVPVSIFSLTGRSSVCSFQSMQFGAPRSLETPPNGERAFEAHATLVACPAPRRVNRTTSLGCSSRSATSSATLDL